jgi:hypothetical protein
MSPEELRRKAEVCLRFAERAEDQEIATRLKIMAGEYLIQAEMLAEGATSVEQSSFYRATQSDDASTGGE